MSCEQFSEAMSPYIDGMIAGDEKMEFEDHLKICHDCKEEFEALKIIIDEVQGLPEEKLPDYYHRDLMLKLYKSNEDKFNKKRFYGNWKVFSGLAAVFIFLIVIAGSLGRITVYDEARKESEFPRGTAGHTNGILANYDTMKEEMEIQDMAVETPQMNIELDLVKESEGSRGITKVRSPEVINRKIIYSTMMSLEVEVFDNAIRQIRDIAEQSGGYVENSSSYIYHSEPEREIYLKQGSIVIRIPVDKYGEIQTRLSNMGHLIHQEETSTNVTEEYIETESRIRMLEVEQDRLLEIMGRADKVEDLIKLEERLNQVRTDLEIYKSKIKNWDQLISFSTFTIDLREVKEIEPIKITSPNLSTKIKSSFNKSLNDIRREFEEIAILMAYMVIPFILMIIVLAIAFLVFKPLVKIIIRKIKNWRDKKL